MNVVIDWNELGYAEPYNTELPTFYLRDGLCLQRLGDGRIRLTKMPNLRSWRLGVIDHLPGYHDGLVIAPEFDLIITQSELASLVAAASARGETGETYQEIMAFLTKEKA